MRRILCSTGVAAVLVLATAAQAMGSFPGENGMIVFDRSVPSQRFGQVPHVFLANADGSGVTELTQGDTVESHASWSPDGRKLVLTVLARITTRSLDGTPGSSLPRGNFPAWSPDGTRIVYSQEVQPLGVSDFDIWVIAADGSADPIDIIGDPPESEAYDAFADWSPDGERIAFFSSGRAGGGPGIYTITPDGGELRQLTSGRDFFPNWSPDGSRIAFQRHPLQGGEGEIYVVDADGGNPIQLTDNDITDETPVWSPDGTKIAFGRETFGLPNNNAHSVWVMNANGSAETPLITAARNPDWQPLASRPPDCSRVRATPGRLWPPDQRLVKVTLSGATDPDGDVVTIKVLGVTADEQIAGDFFLGPASNQVRLRAERDGLGDGRVYTVEFEASDGKGGRCTGTATVTVPHSQRAAPQPH